MEWQNILYKARLIKEEFERSYKCLNVDRPTRKDTIKTHIENLFTSLERIRVLFNVNYNRLTASHQAAAEAFFLDLKDRVFRIAYKKGISVELPNSIHESEPYSIVNLDDADMTQTVVEFLNTASKLVTDFDGKSENLQAFIDSLSLIDTIKGGHEAVAVSLIRTKLKGNARNLIGSESTISEIIHKLRQSVKGESVEVLTAKIMNIRQASKTANNYCSEIESLAKSLENAYITDGLSTELACRYSTQTVVRAITKNCTMDRVRLIMEAGQFNNMNEVISKFVSSCTEATGQQNTLLHIRNRYRRPVRRGNTGHYRGGFGNPRNNGNINRQGQTNNYSGRSRQNTNNRPGNRNFVRATESCDNGSENL